MPEQVLTVLAGVVPVSVAWALNEWSKRREAARSRREERYFRLLSQFGAFYESATPDLSGRNEFAREGRLSWLYCPDHIVRALNEFFEALLSPARSRFRHGRRWPLRGAPGS